jgi:hypothetical protein
MSEKNFLSHGTKEKHYFPDADVTVQLIVKLCILILKNPPN